MQAVGVPQSFAIGEVFGFDEELLAEAVSGHGTALRAFIPTLLELAETCRLWQSSDQPVALARQGRLPLVPHWAAMACAWQACAVAAVMVARLVMRCAAGVHPRQAPGCAGC